MVEAPGVEVAATAAEATRQALQDAGMLRLDLHPLSLDQRIVFAVRDESSETTGVYDFRERPIRAKAYTDLLPPTMRADAPRAFDSFGDIAILKIPDSLSAHREQVGDALRQFLGVRAVFHDGGVQGEFRVRTLTRIAGTGNSETTVTENGVNLHVDVGRAYFSPRLATERARVVRLIQPGEYVVDLFGGVAPLGVQAAKQGARVTSIDLNPAAEAFAKQNAQTNGVDVDVRCGDARAVAAKLDPAERVIMNLPHGAGAFLDVAKQLVKPGGMVHFHEIMADEAHEARGLEVAKALGGTVHTTRHVRNYAATDSHWVFDIRIGDKA